MAILNISKFDGGLYIGKTIIKNDVMLEPYKLKNKNNIETAKMGVGMNFSAKINALEGIYM